MKLRDQKADAVQCLFVILSEAKDLASKAVERTQLAYRGRGVRVDHLVAVAVCSAECRVICDTLRHFGFAYPSLISNGEPS